MAAASTAHQPAPKYLLVALSETERGSNSGRRFRRVRWIKRSLTLALVSILVLLTGGLATTTPSSEAFLGTDIEAIVCGYTDPNLAVVPEPWPGVAGFTASLAIPQGWAVTGKKQFDRYTQPYANKSVTAEEWYGTAGLMWRSSNYKKIDGICIGGILRQAAGIISTLLWAVVLLIGSIGLNVYEIATSIDPFGPFLDTLDDVIRSLASTLYLPFLAPMVMIGALWMGWQGLVKRRSSEAVQGAIWMIAATSAAFIFFGQPKAIAEATNNVVTTVSTTIIKTVASAGTVATNTGEGPCSLADGSADISTRTTKCALWYTFLFTPWATGQFGAANGTVTVERYYTLDAGVLDTIGVIEDGGLPVEFTAENTPKIGSGFNAKPLSNFRGDGQSGIPVAWLQLDSWSLNHDEVVTGKWDLDGKRNQWWGITQRFAKSPGGVGADKNLTNYEIPEGEVGINPPGTSEWSGDNVPHRFLVAILALVAMIAGAAPVMFISFILVIQQIGFIFLLLFAPVFLLIGVHPGFGRRIALNWLEQILSLCLKRIGNSLVLGILLALVAAIITSANGSWFIQVLLVIAASISAITFRKRIVDGMSQVNLGGAGGDFGSQASSTLRNATNKSVSSAANATSTLASGGGAGGIATALVGGGLLGAGVSGVVNSARNRKGDVQGGIGDEGAAGGSQDPNNPYNDFYESSVVGRAEMDDYQKAEEERRRSRERAAMDGFNGTPEEIAGWQEWAQVHGTYADNGMFIPRAIPRPNDPALQEALRDAGLIFQEDLDEQVEMYIESANSYGLNGANGTFFPGTVERPDHPFVEKALADAGIVFVDQLEDYVDQMAQWSEENGSVGVDGEVIRRVIPESHVPDNPHFIRALERAGVPMERYEQQELFPNEDAIPEAQPNRTGPQKPNFGQETLF